MDDIDIFFADPGLNIEKAGVESTVGDLKANKFGLLYLLRRDIRACLPSSKSKPQARIPWLGAIGILAGIDLLAQHKAGTNEDDREKASKKDDKDHWKYSSTQRFKKFIEEHFPEAAKADPDVLFQLRCALAHSYSTYQEQVLGRGEKKTVNTYEFLLTDDPSEEIVRRHTDTLFSVNLYALHDGFEAAISDYEKSVRDSKEVGADFSTMVSKIGSVFIYPPQEKISFDTISTSTLSMGASGVPLNGFLPKDLEQSFSIEPTK